MTRAPRTWRSPQSPRSWRTISAIEFQPDTWASEQTARRVHGQLAVKLDPTLLRPRGRLAEAAEAEALEHEPHERRERVVGVERVDVLLRHAGHAIDGELLLRRRVAEF